MIQPWQTEGDAFDWTDEATGLPCVMRRNGMKAWCGYVGVAPGSPLFGLTYQTMFRVPEGFLDDRPTKIDEVGVLNMFVAALGERRPDVWELTLLARCHGGLTYSQAAWWGKDDPRWWFGFDCSHAGDRLPAGGYSHSGDIYRTADFVRQMCRQLAEDLVEIAAVASPVVEEAAR